ncbi:hypothetical protein [Paenibacillus sp. 7541]|uniref:lipase family protein n=1 Tax=Paenibacillus sp. 7541 TaxID=2026236 RepID=UPI000BA7CC17|nr:hypothetical protein [Paenibacillus sp. 7541]PAK51512.1 hypothetical protein CHH75_15085 [Paenibacillus sp. 7541]
MVDDETYQKLSRLAYKDLKEGEQIGDLPGWEVLEDTKSYRVSGFDAVTFVNRNSGEAVIAYRGTEGSEGLSASVPDYITDAGIGINEIKRKTEVKRPFDEHLTKIEDTVGLTTVKDWFGEQSRKWDKTTDFIGKNQLYQAEDYAKDMQKKYKNFDFSMTGHSLGGANAQYAAAYTGIPAVTFSAPSVIGSLSPEYRRRAENGEFNDLIVNYAHPGDIIASGAFGGYEGHVGSTYYIDSSYREANDGLSIKDKIANTLGGPNYHQLDRYQFENGYISNPLYDGATDKRVDFSRAPWASGSPALSLFGQAMPWSLTGGLAGLSAGTIQVTPAELRNVAERWRAHAQHSHNELQGIRQRLARYLNSSHSRRLQPIVQQLDASIVSMSQWHLQHTTDIVNYISYKADLFERTDRSS